MNVINEYHISQIDTSKIVRFIKDHGKLITIKKQEYFIRQHDRSPMIGFVEKGMLRYTRIDNQGKEHIVGYTFQSELTGEYTANLCNRESIVSIQAIMNSSIYVINYEKFRDYLDESKENQELGRIITEQLFVMTYRRLIDSYCCTPEERYIDLMKQYPMLKELVTLKEIASFIGVTPETVSKIRRKLLGKNS